MDKPSNKHYVLNKDLNPDNAVPVQGYMSKPSNDKLRQELFKIVEPAVFHHTDKSELDRALDNLETLIAQEVTKAYNKGYNANARDCYCDSPGATEGVIAHHHLLTDSESSNIRPDIATLSDKGDK